MKRAAEVTRLALALLPLVFIDTRVRQVVEGSMVLHMALQFPLLLLAGAAAAQVLAGRGVRIAVAWGRFDREGLLATVWLSGIAASWMVPAAIDAALMHPAAAAWKYAGWWLAGWCLALAWPTMATALRLFLLGNLSWMCFTVGLLYTEAEQRLCVSYLADEQVWTGRALCGAALLLLGGVVALAMQRPRRGARQPA